MKVPDDVSRSAGNEGDTSALPDLGRDGWRCRESADLLMMSLFVFPSFIPEIVGLSNGWDWRSDGSSCVPVLSRSFSNFLIPNDNKPFKSLSRTCVRFPPDSGSAPSSAASARDRREFPPSLDGKSLQGESASEPAGPGPAASAPSARLEWLEAPKVPPVLLLLLLFQAGSAVASAG